MLSATLGAALCGNVVAREGVVEQKIDEIVVTATRRSVALEDLASSVSALSAEQLALIRAGDLLDIVLHTPGISFTDIDAGRQSFTFRGINSIGSSGTTALYIDKTPLATDIRLFDIDRVETLRGPQGTLFGASSMGGAIRTITKAPKSTEVLIDPTHPRHLETLKKEAADLFAMLNLVKTVAFSKADKAEFDDQIKCFESIDMQTAVNFPVRMIVSGRFRKEEKGNFEKSVKKLRAD